MTKPVALIILDGWGYREELEHNAIAKASTPNFDRYWQTCPHALLEASGLAVGLSPGQIGNSEVGHMTIGAGKIIDTDLVRVNKAIETGEFDQNQVFHKLFAHVKKHQSALHVMGLIGPGGVHSHQGHLVAFLRLAKQTGIEKIIIHAFTDGRDTPPQSARGYLEELEQTLTEVGIGFIASVSGRFYAMDRDNNWDRVARAEAAIFNRQAKTTSPLKPSELVATLHQQGLLDEHLEPIVFLDETGQSFQIEDNDGIFFFNIRADRARMLSKKIAGQMHARNWHYVTLTEYEPGSPAEAAFARITIETTLAKEISQAGLSQAHIAETEKFPHATYFLNGGVETRYPGEEHIMLDSRKDVATHDLAPKMRAAGIADKAIEAINKGTDFIFINFANPDMVGHTANVPAIIEAVEEVDYQLERVLAALHAKDGVAFVTADHGNAEVNVDPITKDKHSAHTLNPVPAFVTKSTGTLQSGTLADIAPTILKLLDLPVPPLMTGQVLYQE